MKNRFSLKSLLFRLAIPVLTGGLSAWLINGHTDRYASLPRPPLSPPMWLFPVVWTILYLLMGISSYLVSRSDCPDRKNALALYSVQLAVNFIWPLLFFNAQAYLAAFVCLAILWVLVLLMIQKFYCCSVTASLLQLPYLIWLTFAGYLNLAIYLLV